MTTASTQPQEQDKSIGGIASIIIGVLLITLPVPASITLVVFLGIYWLVTGILGIVTIFTRKDKHGWGWALFLGIVGIIAGLLILQHPYIATPVVASILGIILAGDGLIIGGIHPSPGFRG